MDEKKDIQPDSFEVVELDDSELDEVSGGANGNCPCPPGSPVPAGSWDNGNCPQVVVIGRDEGTNS